MPEASFNYTVQLEGFDEMAKRFRNSPDAVAKATKAGLDMATLVVQGKAKENAPVDKDTLRGSITRKVEGNEGRVGTNISYARYQEEGTGIYGKRGAMIVPKNAQYLAFTPKGGSKIVFAKAVRGVRAKKFLQSGVEDLKGRMQQVKQKAFEILLKSI